jgi:hypothetical protein
MDYLDNITKNTQRMSNTFTQGSKLTGGTSAQCFNIQGFRIVKGYANINSSRSLNPGDQSGIYNGLIIDDNGNRVMMQSGDIILAVITENISGEQLIPAPGVNGGFNLYFCDVDGVNGPETSPGNTTPICYCSYGTFNSGYNYAIFSSQAISPYTYLNIHANDVTVLINPIQKVGVSLLVSNANLCQ